MEKSHKRGAKIARYFCLILAIMLFIAGLTSMTEQCSQYLSERAAIVEKIEEFRAMIAKVYANLNWIPDNTVPTNAERNETEPTDANLVETIPIETEPEISDLDAERQIPFAELLAVMEEYNRQLNVNGQTKLLIDNESYETAPLDPYEYGLETDVVGIITIPKIDVELPLFLGANYGNLLHGCATLSETSMPIGGESTNCVIAGHRGWNTQKFLRDVEKLEVGDLVYIENLWETMVYRVCQVSVVYPNEIDKVYIQEGRDLITLLTCHPYRVNSHRYLVYCERVEDAEPETMLSTESPEYPETSKDIEPTDVTNMTEAALPEEGSSANHDATFTISDGIVFESSENDIFLQNYFPWICMSLALLLLVILGVTWFARKCRERADRKKASA